MLAAYRFSDRHGQQIMSWSWCTTLPQVPLSSPVGHHDQQHYNNNNNPWTIFIVLLSWPRAIARVHSVHLMNCRTAHKRPSTLRPSHLTWAVSPPVGSYRLQPPSPFIIITQTQSWYSFTVPRRVEGWVDLGTAGRVDTARAQGCKSQWLCDKHNCPQHDSIPGPRALQSDMLPLDHCDLHVCCETPPGHVTWGPNHTPSSECQ